jgi:hypothetical protein
MKSIHFSGLRYDAVPEILHLSPKVPGNVRVFISTATGYGTTGVKNGEPFLDVIAGSIEANRIDFVPV